MIEDLLHFMFYMYCLLEIFIFNVEIIYYLLEF